MKIPQSPLLLPQNRILIYSEKDFDSKHYNDARPLYPDSSYNTFLNYHRQIEVNVIKFAMNVGCRSGFVGLKLTEYFTRVLGTDLSETIILNNQINAISAAKSNIDFVAAPARKSPESVQPHSVDMVTTAEAYHWMDMDKFFQETARILKPHGTLSY